MIIPAHSVKSLPSGLSWMQERLICSNSPVRLASAPTGSGKSYAFMRAVISEGARVLFIVPTKRLLQNLIDDARQQAENALRDRGLTERAIGAWKSDNLITWSSNQEPDQGCSVLLTRARQTLDASASQSGRIIFAIPEIVVKMIRGVPLPEASMLNPFSFITLFDHVVFDEFHTVDDRAFGLACLLACCAVEERKAKVSLLSATPIDVTGLFEKFGVQRHDMEVIKEQITAGCPKGNRSIHGHVELRIVECSPSEAVQRNIDELRRAATNGRQIIIIYDSLQQLKKEECSIRSFLINSGIEDNRILSINSIDDSMLEYGQPALGRRYADPREYDVLLCTSSIEVGVNFRSVLMIMNPGLNPAGFMQRVGRVARGNDDGRILICLPENQRNRQRWIKRVVRTIREHDELDIESFVEKILHEVKQRLVPSVKDIHTDPEMYDVQFFQRPSWRGIYWAALFVVAICEQMNVQKAAKNRLFKISPNYVWAIKSRIDEIRSVRIVDDCRRAKDQPHKLWVKALLNSALAYRDIGATITVVDPDGSRRQVRESFLLRCTDILRTHIICDLDSERVVELLKRPLDQEIVRFSDKTPTVKMNLHVRSPIGNPGFDVSIHESEKGSEHLYCRLVYEWGEHFGRSADGPHAKVMKAATYLVKVLGKPPLEEDYEDAAESAIFA